MVGIGAVGATEILEMIHLSQQTDLHTSLIGERPLIFNNLNRHVLVIDKVPGLHHLNT